MTVSPDETLITKGVKSTVYAYNEAGEPAGRFGRYGVGHMALFDLDDHMKPHEARLTFEKRGIEGPTVLIESSDGNYHAWNLTVRDFADTAGVLDRGGDDTGHNNVGKKRGWWRLRVGPKITANSDVYKPTPEFVGSFWVDPKGRGKVCISGPHEELLKRTYEGYEGCHARKCERRGNLIEVVSYTTFTDEGKALQKQVESGSLRPSDNG